MTAQAQASTTSDMRFRVSQSGSEAFIVCSDSASGEVIRWRFIPD